MYNTYFKNSFLLVLISISTALADNAVADEGQDWYVGTTVGVSANSLDRARITSGLYNGGQTTQGGLATTDIIDQSNGTAGTLYVGRQLGDYLAFEAGYFDLGKLGFTANTDPAGSLTGKLNAHGENIDLVGRYQAGPKMAVFARGGVIFAHADADFSNTGAVQLLRSSYTENSTSYKIGLGASFKLSDSVQAQFEADRYRFDDAVYHTENVVVVAFGLAYHF